MRKIWVAPFCALAVGLVGSYLRKLQLANAFEETSGLTKRGAPETAAVVAVTAVAAAAALVIAIILSRKYDAPANWAGACGGGNAALICSAVFGALTLAGGVLLIIGDGTTDRSDTVFWVMALLTVATGVSEIVMSFAARDGKDGAGLSLASIVPPLMFVFRMISVYGDNAGNPVIMSFVFQCLAYAAASLGFFYIAGYVYGRRNSGATIFTGLVSIVLLCTAAADCDTLNQLLPTIGGAGFLTVNMAAFIKNLEPLEEDKKVSDGG